MAKEPGPAGCDTQRSALLPPPLDELEAVQVLTSFARGRKVLRAVRRAESGAGGEAVRKIVSGSANLFAPPHPPPPPSGGPVPRTLTVGRAAFDELWGGGDGTKVPPEQGLEWLCYEPRVCRCSGDEHFTAECSFSQKPRCCSLSIRACSERNSDTGAGAVGGGGGIL